MNKLFVFGDSCSSEIDKLRSNPYVNDYVLKYHNGVSYKPWFEYLAEMFEFEHLSFGLPGACNYKIMERVSENSDLITEGDIIIIQWSVLDRFRVALDNDGRYETVLPTVLAKDAGKWLLDGLQANIKSSNTEISLESLMDIGYNRIKYPEIFRVEMNSWSFLLYQHFKMKNCKVYFWGLPAKQNYYLLAGMRYMEDNQGLIFQETKKEIMDWHFSAMGNKIFAEELYRIIISGQMDNITKRDFFNKNSKQRPLI